MSEETTTVELDAESLRTGRELRIHAYEQEPGLWVLCGDDAIYMNHDDEPSCDDPDPQRPRTALQDRIDADPGLCRHLQYVAAIQSDQILNFCGRPLGIRCREVNLVQHWYYLEA